MARIRTIKPEFWESETIASLSRDARLLFICCFNLADDDGLLRWNAAYLKSSAFMYDADLLTESLSELMCELVDAGLIHPYIGGKMRATYGWIVTFREHQRINRPTPSKLPAPSQQDRDMCCKTRGISRTNSLTDPISESLTESITAGKEGEGEGKGKSIAVALPPDDDDFSLTPEEPKPAPKPNPSPEPYPAEFEAFWSAYPANDRGRKRGKAKSHTIWKTIRKSERPQVTGAAANYAREQTEFIRDPERFLKDDWWRDWVGEAKPRPDDWSTVSHAPVVSLEARRREIEAKRRESHTEASK